MKEKQAPDRILPLWDPLEQAREPFRAQLARLNLAPEQIDAQALPELEGSLETVDEAIAQPASFGTVRLKMNARGELAVAAAGEAAHLELGILPLLLESKHRILERIRLLNGAARIDELRRLAEQVPDPGVRQALTQGLAGLKVDAETLYRQAHPEPAGEGEGWAAVEGARGPALAPRAMSRLRPSFLEKESMTTLVGGLLLLIFAISQVVSMFYQVQPTEIIGDSFLLILGYFFGRGGSEGDAKKKEEQEKKA